jgi:hypothetical protein
MDNFRLGLSILSKTKSVLGVSLETHSGVKVNDDTNEISQISYCDIYIGLIFTYIQFSFTYNEHKIKISPSMDKFMSLMKEHIDELASEENKDKPKIEP